VESTARQPISIELQILELVCSRLCHDLISPVGAVGNGLELMAEEGGGELLADARDLVENSARRAAALLQLYRSAYGNAGNQAGFGAGEAVKLAREAIDPERIELRASLPASAAWPAGFGKLTLNAILTVMEWLPRGGILSLSARESGGVAEFELAVEGQQAGYSDETAGLTHLDRTGVEVTAHNIQPYLTGLIAAQHGYRLELSRPAAGRAEMKAVRNP
jgi:histidine phosphotransferase ChpT